MDWMIPLIGTVVEVVKMTRDWNKHPTERQEKDKYILAALIIGILWLSWGFAASRATQLQRTLDGIISQGGNLTSKVDSLRGELALRDGQIIQMSKDNQELKNDNKNLTQKVIEMSLTVPKLLPSGGVELSSGVTGESKFSQGLAKADELLKNGQIDSAYEMGKELAHVNPKFGGGYLVMGVAEFARHKYAHAERLLNKAINLGLATGNLSYAYYYLGYISATELRSDDAITYLERSVRADSTNKEAKALLRSFQSEWQLSH